MVIIECHMSIWASIRAVFLMAIIIYRKVVKNVHSIIIGWNVSVARQVILLVTIPLFGFCQDSLNRWIR